MADSEQFQRDLQSYEQNCEQLRHLNTIMWQVPIVAMTLNGGLWYGIASIKGVDAPARSAVLVFSALANVVLIFLLNRVRNVFGEYLTRVKAFNPSSFADAAHENKWFALLKDRGVVIGFSFLLAVAGAMSLAGAIMILTGALTFNP